MAETASTLGEAWQAHREAFFALLPAPGDLTLDVGRGDGQVARDLEALGHRVLSVTGAASLPVADAAADLVVAFMSLQDMDDARRGLREYARVLRPGGLLCLGVGHPIAAAGTFSGPGHDAEFAIAGGYFESRSLEDYFRGLEDAGFLVEELREPRPGDGGRGDRVPQFMDLRAVRA